MRILMEAMHSMKEKSYALWNDAYGSGNACCTGVDEKKPLTTQEFAYAYAVWALQVAPGALLLRMLQPRITYLAASCETIAYLTAWPKVNSEKFVLSDHRRAHCIRDALSV